MIHFLASEKKVDERIASLDRVRHAVARRRRDELGQPQVTLAARLRVVGVGLGRGDVLHLRPGALQPRSCGEDVWIGGFKRHVGSIPEGWILVP